MLRVSFKLLSRYLAHIYVFWGAMRHCRSKANMKYLKRAYWAFRVTQKQNSKNISDSDAITKIFNKGKKSALNNQAGSDDDDWWGITAWYLMSFWLPSTFWHVVICCLDDTIEKAHSMEKRRKAIFERRNLVWIKFGQSCQTNGFDEIAKLSVFGSGPSLGKTFGVLSGVLSSLLGSASLCLPRTPESSLRGISIIRIKFSKFCLRFMIIRIKIG